METRQISLAAATTGRLWQQAPFWRWSLIGAGVCTGLLAFTLQTSIEKTDAPAPRINAAPPTAAVSHAPISSPPSSQSAANAAAPTRENRAAENPSHRGTSATAYAGANNGQAPQGIARKESPPAANQRDSQEKLALNAKPQSLNPTAEPNPSTQQPQANSCGTQIPRSFPPLQHYVRKVVGFMPRPEALALLESTQKQVGMLISPRFVDNQRVKLVPVSGQSERYIVALVPQGMQVAVGDVVDFTSGFKLDPQYPCNYVPNLIDHIVATSAPPATMDATPRDTSANNP